MTSALQHGTIAKRLGEWVAGLTHADVPDSARQSTRRAIVDVVGVAFAGSTAPLASAVRQQAQADWRSGPCTLIGGGGAALVAPAAAHANAVAAHVLDFDANFNTGMVFAPAVLFPAILATGEQSGASGADLVAAFAAGTEIVCVLAEALSDAPYRKDRDSLFYKGWFNSAVLGPIGAAAATARIIGLDASQATQAIGIAAVQAGGLRIAVGSDMKPYLCGRAAEAGLRAAFMAKAGAEAPADVFEGSRGLIQVINGGAWTASAFERLGGFADPGTSFKLYPACSSIQAAAEAFELLLTRENIAREEVVHLRCDVTNHIASNLAFPRPANVTQAQFSMPFALGCILAHGHFRADQLTEAALGDTAVQAAMTKVEMQPATLFDDEQSRRDGTEATRVTVTARDGRVVSHLQLAATGKPVNPMADDLLDRKFQHNTAAFLGTDASDHLLRQLRALEQVTDVRQLFAGLNDVRGAA
jgi:2-methylcitrate dehydratase PrpD